MLLQKRHKEAQKTQRNYFLSFVKLCEPFVKLCVKARKESKKASNAITQKAPKEVFEKLCVTTFHQSKRASNAITQKTQRSTKDTKKLLFKLCETL